MTGERYEKGNRQRLRIRADDEQFDTASIGKRTLSTVTSRRLVPADDSGSTVVKHVTAFDYAIIGTYSDPGIGGQNNGIAALVKRRVEPNADPTNEATQNTELHTAYDYDGVGNVTLTKECASDFGTCDRDPQHTGHLTPVPDDDGQPMIRGTMPPQGQGLIPMLNYGAGRFPVLAKNAMGHAEYSAYDPTTGFLRQKTGPNGITTCYRPDPFARQEAETLRCGSDAPLTTTNVQYRNANADLPLARIVAVTSPPMGDIVWTYSDALGRKIDSRKRGFDGRFIESTTSFDVQGRPTTVETPLL